MNGDIYKVVTYKEQGVSHQYYGKPCEDHVGEYFDSKSGVVAVAVSDGAGSYKNAETGSRITSQKAVQFMAKKFERLYELDEETFADYMLQEVYAALIEEAERNQYDIMSLSATLLVAAMHPDGRYLFFHVGDGAVLAYTTDGEVKILSQYEHEEAANITTFVTVPNTDYKMGRGRGDVLSFLLMSDGPEPHVISKEKAVGRLGLMIQMSFFFSRERMEDELEGFTELLKQNNMTDDASFAVLSDKRGAGKVFGQMDAGFKELLFGLPLAMKKKTKKNYEGFFGQMAIHPRGMHPKKLCSLFHIHKNRVLKKKLDGFIYAGVIKKENGRYIF